MRHALLFLFALGSVCILLPTFLILRPASVSTRLSHEVDLTAEFARATKQAHLGGSIIMPKMQNATAKAILGRSTWHLMHTMAQRYPEAPTEDERETFKSFIYLLSRLCKLQNILASIARRAADPCAECAAHFQGMLQEYPVQTANRNTASLYLCMLHNKVNVRLGKDEFDCSKLEGLYDCGCGDEAEVSSRVAVGTVEEGEGSDKFDPLTGEELING